MGLECFALLFGICKNRENRENREKRCQSSAFTEHVQNTISPRINKSRRSMEHGAGSMEFGSWSLELEIGSVVATESQLLIMFNRKLIEKAECAKLVCKINESRGIALYA